MSPQSLMILRAAESSCSWYLTVDVPKWNGRHFVVKIIYINLFQSSTTWDENCSSHGSRSVYHLEDKLPHHIRFVLLKLASCLRRRRPKAPKALECVHTISKYIQVIITSALAVLARGCTTCARHQHLSKLWNLEKWDSTSSKIFWKNVELLS